MCPTNPNKFSSSNTNSRPLPWSEATEPSNRAENGAKHNPEVPLRVNVPPPQFANASSFLRLSSVCPYWDGTSPSLLSAVFCCPLLLFALFLSLFSPFSFLFCAFLSFYSLLFFTIIIIRILLLLLLSSPSLSSHQMAFSPPHRFIVRTVSSDFCIPSSHHTNRKFNPVNPLNNTKYR